jgi:hypothetical protein
MLLSALWMRSAFFGHAQRKGNSTKENDGAILEDESAMVKRLVE